MVFGEEINPWCSGLLGELNFAQLLCQDIGGEGELAEGGGEGRERSEGLEGDR